MAEGVVSGRRVTARTMAWHLYLILCRGGSIYTGITVDVEARYAAHLSGKGARYTRSHPPLRLLATIAYADRSSAAKAECEVKKFSAAEKRAFCRLHGASGRHAHRGTGAARRIRE